jgi:hypothetical protein
MKKVLLSVTLALLLAFAVVGVGQMVSPAGHTGTILVADSGLPLPPDSRRDSGLPLPPDSRHDSGLPLPPDSRF